MRVGKSISVTLLPRAQCSDCDWTHDPHKRARDEAKWHVRSTGHMVIVITETRDEYRRMSS